MEDVAAARSDFRFRRLGEPLHRYLEAFDAVHPGWQRLVDTIDTLLDGESANEQALAELWSSEAGRAQFRYLGAPPISDDDLATLAEGRLSGAAANFADVRERMLGVMRLIVDPRRFPWLVECRAPTPTERDAAVLASSALMASQRVQTLRRGDEKSAVEGAVKGLLIGMGWVHDGSRRPPGIQKLTTDAPALRHFVTQSNLGPDNADVVVRLDDGRLLAIECKGSNSEINSRKRLNKEAAQNARAWLARFGSDQVVPAVALQGVFKARYVLEAQDTPMAIFWGHRLDDLRQFLLGSR
jgi:XamI restriction endonuclease